MRLSVYFFFKKNQDGSFYPASCVCLIICENIYFRYYLYSQVCSGNGAVACAAVWVPSTEVLEGYWRRYENFVHFRTNVVFHLQIHDFS